MSHSLLKKKMSNAEVKFSNSLTTFISLNTHMPQKDKTHPSVHSALQITEASGLKPSSFSLLSATKHKSHNS